MATIYCRTECKRVNSSCCIIVPLHRILPFPNTIAYCFLVLHDFQYKFIRKLFAFSFSFFWCCFVFLCSSYTSWTLRSLIKNKTGMWDCFKNRSKKLFWYSIVQIWRNNLIWLSKLSIRYGLSWINLHHLRFCVMYWQSNREISPLDSQKLH